MTFLPSPLYVHYIYIAKRVISLFKRCWVCPGGKSRARVGHPKKNRKVSTVRSRLADGDNTVYVVHTPELRGRPAGMCDSSLAAPDNPPFPTFRARVRIISSVSNHVLSRECVQHVYMGYTGMG
jgi:hypothetical protein